MNKILAILLATVLATSVFAQDPKPVKIVRKIKIQSMSPQLLAWLLRGNKNYALAPEPGHNKN